MLLNALIKLVEYVCWMVWPLYKWLLRKLTGKCELQRICQSHPQGAPRTIRIENTLRHSRCPGIIEIFTDDAYDGDVSKAMHEILKAKDINLDAHAKFGAQLKSCLQQIFSYKKLLHEVESVRRLSYDRENADHERELLKLWSLVSPNNSLTSRISKQWTEIGFQGEDPMTDFRGMGLLGLHNLVFLSKQHPQTAMMLLSHSHNPNHGYPWAVVGINITSMAYHLLKTGHLKTHFYNVVHGSMKLVHFHGVYCYLFYHFDEFWFTCKPRDVMEFNRVRDEFARSISHRLTTNHSTLLQAGFLDIDQVD